MKKILILIAFILISSNLYADIGVFDGIVTTSAVSNITIGGANCGGTVTLIADDPVITEKGLVWSLNINPSTADSKLIIPGNIGPGPVGPVAFTGTMSGMSQSTLYHVRAYITNADGTFYGGDVTFTTIPTLPEWGLIAMGSLLAAFGGWFVMKRIA